MADARVVGTHVWPADADTPVAVAPLELDWGGPIGDRHHGLTKPSDSRLKHVYPRGTEIRNSRQVSIVDAGELRVIAERLGVPGLRPGLLADNICTEGIEGLTALPAMTRLIFPSGAVLALGGENLPCTIAGTLVGDELGTSPQAFPKAAMGLRGVTGWVERPGSVAVGDAITVITP